MTTTPDETTSAEVPAHHSEHRMQCMELWGGISEIQTSVTMTGLDGYVFSRPHDQGTHGGDVYYFTSCASGRISRVLLADVSGHGMAVAETADLLRSIMRRKVNVIGQSSLMSAVNEEFSKVAPGGGFATAIVASYFAPTKSLTISAAGHPPPLLFRKSTGLWTSFAATDAELGMTSGLPLGIADDTNYEPQTITFEPGDILLAYTDAFFESRDADDRLLQTDGLLQLINRAPTRSHAELISWLVGELQTISPQNLTDDDATAILIQPTGDGIPMKNNLLAPIRMIRGVQEVDAGGRN